MKSQDLIYKYRAKVKYASILLLIIGIAIGYFYFGTEPHETIGGFLSGIGLVFFLLSIAIKPSKDFN